MLICDLHFQGKYEVEVGGENVDYPTQFKESYVDSLQVSLGLGNSYTYFASTVNTKSSWCRSWCMAEFPTISCVKMLRFFSAVRLILCLITRISDDIIR